MKVFHSDRFAIPLPPGHRFPATKYALLREALVARGVLAAGDLVEAPLARRADLLRAHAPSYVDAILDGSIDARAMRRIGFPWSRELVVRTLASVGGSLAAAEAALDDGIAGNLAGGTHHAHADAGSGYCVFNDHAVVALELLARGKVRRVAIVDLDVHQGDGNAAILGGRDDVYVLSLHGARNFPFVKVPSTVDVELADGTGDEAYLAALDGALPGVLRFAPDLVLYQAGVDPLAEDRLGKLALTFDGLGRRDRVVLEACRRAGVPVALALGGGYAQPIELTVDAHVNTYRVARAVFA